MQLNFDTTWIIILFIMGWGRLGVKFDVHIFFFQLLTKLMKFYLFVSEASIVVPVVPWAWQ
jgi:hypothetical protein